MDDKEYVIEQQSPVTFKAFFTKFKKRWYVYAAIIILLTAAGFVLGKFFMREYASSATLIVQVRKLSAPYDETKTPSTGEEEQARTQFLLYKTEKEQYEASIRGDMTYALLVNSSDVSKKIVDKFNAETGESYKWSDFSHNLKVSKSGLLIDLSFSSKDPEHARKMLKITVDEIVAYQYTYITYDGDTSVENKDNLDLLVLSEPSAAVDASGSKTVTYTLLFFAIGVVLSCGIIIAAILVESGKKEKEAEDPATEN